MLITSGRFWFKIRFWSSDVKWMSYLARIEKSWTCWIICKSTSCKNGLTIGRLSFFMVPFFLAEETAYSVTYRNGSGKMRCISYMTTPFIWCKKDCLHCTFKHLKYWAIVLWWSLHRLDPWLQNVIGRIREVHLNRHFIKRLPWLPRREGKIWI